MKKPARIRIAEINDYATCLPLFETLYHGDIGSDFRETFEDYINRGDGLILLAECPNKAIGVLVGSYHLDIDWEGRIAKVDALIVHEAHRKKGIGKKLLRHFIKLSKAEKCKAVKSRINRGNTIAQKFHKSLGFTEAKTYEYFLDLETATENSRALSLKTLSLYYI